MIHKQLPSTSDKNIFVNRADSGCISTMNGVVYSVGKEIISMDWISLSLKVLTKTKQSALAEGCVGLTLSSGLHFKDMFHASGKKSKKYFLVFTPNIIVSFFPLEEIQFNNCTCTHLQKKITLTNKKVFK